MVRDPLIGRAACVIDGLDECEPSSAELILDKMNAMHLSDSPLFTRTVILSREFPDIFSRKLGSFPRVRLDPDADAELNGDIKLFISKKVDTLAKHHSYSEQIRKAVARVFSERAQGTFLWVGLAARDLANVKPVNVQSVLDHLPEGLDAMYGRMLLQIGNPNRRDAALLLRWVVMANVPLQPEDLAVAIGVKAPNMTPKQAVLALIELCGSILVHADDGVSLVH